VISRSGVRLRGNDSTGTNQSWNLEAFIKGIDCKLKLTRLRLYHLAILIAVSGVACFVFVLHGRREVYRSTAERYTAMGNGKLRLASLSRLQSIVEWRLALQLASSIPDARLRNEIEAIARFSEEGRAAQDSRNSAEWETAMAEWSLQMARRYKRLENRPWESVPPLPVPPKEPIQFRR
jgi:hypothetical protein